MDAIVALEDGTVFHGTYFTARREALGEVVFNTSMSGYQEVITDPSYSGQIVVMTCPHIGNVGVNPLDMESRGVQVAGLVVREAAGAASSFRAQGMLGDYLTGNGVPGVEGVDTRALTRKIRLHGAMRGAIAPSGRPVQELLERVKALPSMAGRDLVPAVTRQAACSWSRGFESGFDRSCPKRPPLTLPIAVIDYGCKDNILRCLVETGFDCTVFPAGASAGDILARSPAGVFLSNGPGDPAAVTYAFDTIRTLAERLPVFGICLGHQLTALAFGAATYKMKFGHRGANQPVRNLATGAVEITSQNHGFAVDPDSLSEGLEVSHVNLNDGTVEGLRHRELPVFCVQYHPESSPGPHDSTYLFTQFRKMVEEFGGLV
ncbi:MAG: glutamine-hydrolyzing carbamoyl-phosphate synthase small subunit [Planctomycetes bacterium]|nr:glutamine-hydrolyzing carbamoyl-phosphate synthase small subunit [Planctomycetota bacterium]